MRRGRGWSRWTLGALMGGVLLLLSCLGPTAPGEWGPAGGEVVYVASPQGRVLAINPESRSRGLSFPDQGEWVSPEKRGRTIFATPLLLGDTVYIATFQGEVVALNAATGQPKGAKPLFQGAPIVAPPLLTPKGLLVASGEALHLLDPQGGAQLWEKPFQAQDRLWASPVLLGDKALVVSLDRYLYSLDLARGVALWAKATQGGLTAAPVVADGAIYQGSLDGNLYAWDGEGRPRWDKPFQAQGWVWSQPLYHDGRLYIGDLKGNLYKVKAATGEMEWRFPASGQVRTPALASEEKLFLATSLGWVYALDMERGSLKWQRQLEQGISPVNGPLIAWQRAILVPLGNGQLYALEAETGKIIWSFSLKR